MAESYHDQLLKDSKFLGTEKRLDTELVDKLVLQLNRIYPQILNDKEAQKFRNLGVPTSIRLAELLAHLQGRGEEACYEFYRALHIHAEDVYFSLPTRISRRALLTREPAAINKNDKEPDFRQKLFNVFLKWIPGLVFFQPGHTVLCLGLVHLKTADPKWTNTAADLRRFVLNDRGPWFFLSCFSIAMGGALLYYYGESRAQGDDARRVLGFTALGLGRRAREVLVSYVEDSNGRY